MNPRRFLLACLGLLSCLPIVAQTPAGPIIADHRAVAGFNDIPPQYLAQVRQMLVYVAGESHSTAYGYGPELLAAQSAAHPAASAMMNDIQYAGDQNPSYPTFNPANPRLRIIRGYAGEDFWFSHPGSAAQMPAILERYNSQGVTAFGFGWCWDMTWIPYPENRATERDPVYRVHWSGRSVYGPQGDICWGLDAEDFAVTRNSVNLDTYLTATQSYVDYCTSHGLAIKPFFTTGPVDNSDDHIAYDQNEKGYARELKHARIRSWVTAHNGILFDFADILSHNNAGQAATGSWTDDLGRTRTFPVFHTDNGVFPYADYHFGEVGAVRVAKAMWWMLARMAGWNGLPTGADTAAPSVPTNLAGTATSSTAINLTWTASTDNVGVTGYRIYRATGAGALTQIGTSTTPTYADTALAAATTYRYTVAAYDAVPNVSSQCTAVSVTTQAAPAAPTIVSFTATPATITSGQSSTLRWNVSGATGLSINQGVGTVTGTSRSVSPTATTTYTLTATNASGSTTSTTSVTVNAAPDTQAPTVPTSLAATATTPTTVSLTWTASTDNVGVTGYRIYRATGAGTLASIGTSATASYSDTGLTAATSYRYAVAAYDAVPNTSAQTAAVSVTTPAAPTAGLAGFFREGQTFLTWQENTATTGERYRVYRHTAPITAANRATASLLAELPEGTARFKEMYTRQGTLLTSAEPRIQPRIIARHVIQPLGPQLAAGTGLFVHTTHETAGTYYYAVTTVAGGIEDTTFGPANTTGAIAETAQPPGAVPYVSYTADGVAYTGYTLWMDYALFKDCYLGYAVPFYLTNDRFTTGGATPTMHLDGHGTMPIGAADYSSFGVGDVHHNGTYLPTWYFGMHESAAFDGTHAAGVARSGPVANYLQYRTMQILRWSRRHHSLDTHCFHIDGNSMGASGAYGFALAFPKVVTSVYCNQGMTDYATSPTYGGDFEGNYGAPALANPVHLLPFGDPAYDYYLRHDGTPVYAFRDVAAFLAAHTADDFPLISSGHGTTDGAIDFATQGAHFETYIRNSRHCFGYHVSPGGHGWGGVEGSAMIHLMRTDESRPGFSNVPAKDVMRFGDYDYRGTVADGNRGYMLNVVWGTAENPAEGLSIQETTTFWSLPIFLLRARNAPAGWDDAYTVDITPRNLQRLVVHPGDRFTYRITSIAGAVQATGQITADADSLLLIPAVPIRVAGAIASVEYLGPALPANYAAWRSANFTGADLSNDAVSSPNADPDRCGLTNFARYAFALAARGPVANPITTGTVTSGNATYLTLTFPRRAEATGLSYIVESSTDLVTWTAVPGRTYTAGADPITAQDVVALGATPRRFLRLRVTTP